MKKAYAYIGGLCLCALVTACGSSSDSAVTGGTEANPVAEAQVWLPEQLEVVTNETE